MEPMSASIGRGPVTPPAAVTLGRVTPLASGRAGERPMAALGLVDRPSVEARLGRPGPARRTVTVTGASPLAGS